MSLRALNSRSIGCSKQQPVPNAPRIHRIQFAAGRWTGLRTYASSSTQPEGLPPVPPLSELVKPMTNPADEPKQLGAAEEQLLLPTTTSAHSDTGFASDKPAPDSTFEVSLEDVKASLVDSLYGTERGLNTSNELRAEINELITQLEARNPTPNPTEVMSQLDGSWRLIYTSSSALLAVLALGKLPLVTVGDFFQKIDSLTMTVENKVTLSGPLSRTALSTTASYEVRSPKRLELKLSGGQVAVPELTGDLDLPSSITVLGQFIDLSQLKEAVNPLKEQAEGLLMQLNKLMGQVPDLKVPIDVDEARTWQLTTYVDADLRVSRGDGGSVFIYARN